MAKVELGGNSILIDGQPIFLRSGTIHYWRIEKGDWEDRIAKAAGANLNCIESYIPWFWHEPDEGFFDFSGKTHPQRDLEYFINLIEKYRLWFIPRPGPFINSELRYGGHPEWIFKKYPEIYSFRADGERAFFVGQGTPIPSQLHPTFLRLVDRWYEKVIPILADHSVERGGSAIWAQPDNEMNLIFSYGIEGSLYDPHILGTDGKKGMWKEWLEKKYGGIEAINERYGTKFSEISEVKPPERKLSGKFNSLLILDWLEFKRQHIFQYALHLAGRMRELGLRVPLGFNEPLNYLWVWNSGDHAEFSRFIKENNKKGFFTTGHTYLYGGEMDIFGLSAMISRIEMIKTSTLGGPIFSVEAGAGWCEFGNKTRSDYNWDLLFKVLLGHGFTGFNVYVFAGGVNPPDSTKYGRDYYWLSPIEPDGTLSGPYYSVKNIATFAKAWEKEILETEKEYDATVGIFSALPSLAKPLTDYGEEVDRSIVLLLKKVFGKSEDDLLWEEVFSSLKELFKVLTAHNVNLEYINFDNPNKNPGHDTKVLIVPNPGILPTQGYDFILEHLKKEGKIIFYPTIPHLDINFKEVLKISSLIGARVKRVIPEAGWRADEIVYRIVNGRGAKDVAVDKRIFLFEKQGQSKTSPIETLATFDGDIAAFKQRVLDGEVVVCGFFPKYLTRDSQALFKEIFMDSLGLERDCFSEDGSLHVVRKAKENSKTNTSLVIVANCLGKKSKTRIFLEEGRYFIFPKVSQLEIYPKNARCLWVNLDLGKVTVRYCTSEMIPQDKDRKEFLLYGDIATLGEIALSKRVNVIINGQTLFLREYEGIWIGTYEHGKDPLRMVIG